MKISFEDYFGCLVKCNSKLEEKFKFKIEISVFNCNTMKYEKTDPRTVVFTPGTDSYVIFDMV